MIRYYMKRRQFRLALALLLLPDRYEIKKDDGLFVVWPLRLDDAIRAELAFGSAAQGFHDDLVETLKQKD